ncbi:hypothetical protein [Agrococcus jejuensis]|uniref:Uncharacterized protein n=1 Tax=Agrococcus jejuensis TaxID=399736 RepID=A0A1G8H151_9MICO|nr:hypothetical protein [Agrococcus jejuensis]SDI00367.1 hypothetical protein SAMN04489720_3166 [Agrococcus jejuensis]
MPDLANGKYVSQSDALRQWTPAARDVLVETAGVYGAWVTEQEVGHRVQSATGITTKQPADEWVGALLARVAADAVTRDEPRLASLCVRADLSVGDHAGSAPGEGVQARELQAAQDRLECYRAFGATLPEDGGQPQLTPRRSVARAAAPAKRVARERTPRPAPNGTMRVVVCTSCFMEVPAGTTCRDCGATLSA